MIGFVILFGVLVMLVTIWQVQIVPQQNAEVEYNHYQDVRTDLGELRSEILDTPNDGDAQTASITLGTEYPERTLYVNPPPVYGSIETIDESGGTFRISVENASATDGARSGVERRWNGSDRDFSTSALRYQPYYHELSYDPVLVYEHSVVHDANSGGEPIADQSIVDGRDISLVALDGGLDASTTRSLDLSVTPHGAGVRSVEVSNASSPVVIEVPTHRSSDAWNRSLRSELQSNGGHVLDVTVDQGALSAPWSVARIRLAAGIRYNLQLAGVTVDEQARSSGASVEYLTPVEGDGSTIAVDETTRLVLEAHNEYDNPLANRSVRLRTDRGQLRAGGIESDAVTVQTDRHGRATLRYVGTEAGTATVTATAPDDPGVSPIDLGVSVGSSGSGGTGGGLYGVQWLQDEYDVTVGQTYTFRANTTEPVSDVSASFAVENQSVARIVSAESTIDQSGANVTVAIDGRPPSGNDSNVYVSTRSGGDRASLQVGESQFDVTITGTNSPVEQGETATVDARIDNTGDRAGAQEIDLVIGGTVADTTTVSLEPGANTTVSLQWGTSPFTGTGDYQTLVQSNDDDDLTTITVESNGIPGFELAAVFVAILVVAGLRRYKNGRGDVPNDR